MRPSLSWVIKVTFNNLFLKKRVAVQLSGIEKSKKVSEFLREFLLMVIKDMRITAGEMISDAIEKGKDVAGSIPGNLAYIKDEIIQLVDVLSKTPVELMTLQMLDDSFFKMKLLSITAKINDFKKLLFMRNVTKTMFLYFRISQAR